MKELTFPELPAPQMQNSWPHPIVSAHDVLRTKFESAVAAFRTDDGNLERLRYLCTTLESDCLPLLM